jgi:hypothetical protein
MIETGEVLTALATIVGEVLALRPRVRFDLFRMPSHSRRHRPPASLPMSFRAGIAAVKA